MTTSLHGIHRRQLNHKELLARAGINPSVIEQTTHRVHTDQVARLFRLTQQVLNDEFMGFTAQPCKYGVFATLCELISHCKTLGELLEKASCFYSLITDELQIQLNIEGHTAELSFNLQRPELDKGHFLTEFLMVIWHRFPSWYIAEAIRLRETHFIHSAPAHQDELRVMFPGSLSFNQAKNSLFFDAKYLDKSLVRTLRELDTFLTNHPVDIMTIPGEDHSLEALIERNILNLSGEKLLIHKAGELANKMNISSLTLYRRLQQEGTSYQTIKDNVRREVAIDKLIKEGLSVDEVSEIVGFSESRSFTRAFKHWTGLSPRNYCKYHKTRLGFHSSNPPSATTVWPPM